ncbi:scaffold attachment factor B1-like isoform X2 [Corticium candelabrum]|uniref:scaffold attachment factor B1-like isoform X2 n=1 Tax=Corticium candelabrum TaxID=121492 RepID=UPI002E27158B|nr:scaffold attachment factor B1-like isoform X2 [Corticium candelabrum]
MASLVYGGHTVADMRVADLRKELSDRGLDKTGNKAVLVVRFAKALAAEGAIELKESDIESLEALGSPKGGRTTPRTRSKNPKDAGGDSGRTEQETQTRRQAAADKEQAVHAKNEVVDQEDNLSEVILVEEDGGKVPSLSSDNANRRRLRSSSEPTENRERVKREQEANASRLTGLRYELRCESPESEFRESNLVIDEDYAEMKSEDMDDIIMHGEDVLVEVAEGIESEHMEYEDGSSEQVILVEEPSARDFTVDPSTQTQEDDTPPGTPEEGPESHTSLFSYESTKPDELAGATASEKKARDEDSKRSSLIMNSALEQEISEMEQLDFEEDHLLIYPGADEKYALNPKIEDEETGDEMEAVTAENTKARSGSKEIAVSAESGNQVKAKKQAEKTTGVDLAAKHGCSLWVRNIATTTRANDLKAHFSQFGVVLSAKIVAHPKNREKHYGILTMKEAADATKCIQSLHRTELHGRLILVEKGKLDTNKIIAGAVQKPATNTKSGTSSTQNLSSTSAQRNTRRSTTTRRPLPKKKPFGAKPAPRSSRSKPSPVHPPAGQSRSSSRPDRIVELSDARDEKQLSRTSTRRSRHVERDRTERRRHSSLDADRDRIREPDLRERLGPPVRPQPVSIRDRLGPPIQMERRPLFDPEEDERLRLARERRFIEERARQREAREVERREFERQKEKEKREVQRELERREAERQRELDRQREHELQKRREIERREMERERQREREKLKQLEREREREREKIKELERQRRQQEEERERLQREREIRELAAEKERLRAKQESVRRAATKARRERERMEREMEISLQREREREREREWEMRRKRGPTNSVAMGFEPERKRVARNEWSRAEQADQHMRNVRQVEDISPPHHPPGAYYESDHPPRMKGAPSGRSRWPHGHGNQATQGNLFEEITQNQLDLLGKIASREQIEEQQAQSYDAPPAEESTSFEMNVQPKFGGTGITGLDPITLKRLANAAHGMHGRDPAAVAALAALQQSGGGRAEGGTRGGGRGGGAVAAVGGGGRGRGREAVKKRVAPAIERKTEKKATTAKPVAKKDFGGPPRPAQRSTVSVTQRGRGPPPPPSHAPGANPKSASELALFAQQMMKTDTPRYNMGAAPFPHPAAMIRPHPAMALTRFTSPFGMRPMMRPGMHPMARMPGHDRFNPAGYQHQM